MSWQHHDPVSDENAEASTGAFMLLLGKKKTNDS